MYFGALLLCPSLFYIDTIWGLTEQMFDFVCFVHLCKIKLRDIMKKNCILSSYSPLLKSTFHVGQVAC